MTSRIQISNDTSSTALVKIQAELEWLEIFGLVIAGIGTFATIVPALIAPEVIGAEVAVVAEEIELSEIVASEVQQEVSDYLEDVPAELEVVQEPNGTEPGVIGVQVGPALDTVAKIATYLGVVATGIVFAIAKNEENKKFDELQPNGVYRSTPKTLSIPMKATVQTLSRINDYASGGTVELKVQQAKRTVYSGGWAGSTKHYHVSGFSFKDSGTWVIQPKK